MYGQAPKRALCKDTAIKSGESKLADDCLLQAKTDYDPYTSKESAKADSRMTKFKECVKELQLSDSNLVTSKKLE